MAFKNKPHVSHTDKLCLIALTGILLTVTVIYEATDGATIRAADIAEMDKLPAVIITAPSIDPTPFVWGVESIREAQREVHREAQREALYWQNVPLDLECQTALKEAFEANGVPVSLALGLIEIESNFDTEADNGVSIGLMQINKKYASKFDAATGYSIYTPEGNIRGGIWYLGTLLEKYKGDTQAALCAYNVGHDTSVRGYAKAVLAASEKWGNG